MIRFEPERSLELVQHRHHFGRREGRKPTSTHGVERFQPAALTMADVPTIPTVRRPTLRANRRHDVGRWTPVSTAQEQNSEHISWSEASTH